MSKKLKTVNHNTNESIINNCSNPSIHIKNNSSNNATITVLKLKIEKRLNEVHESNRPPRMNIGYYVLNLNCLQSNDLVNRNKSCCEFENSDCSIRSGENCLQNFDYETKIKTNIKQDFSQKFDIFDSMIETNGISVDMCKEYFEMTKVELPNQQLTSIPEELWRLHKRNHMVNGHIISSNNINANLIDNNMYLNMLSLHPIRVLDLSCNYLKQISGEIRNLYYLQVLNLSNNQLTSLPNEVSELVELEEVHLSYNLFQNLPKALYKLKNLKLLFIRCNYISSIDKDFTCLDHLQLFDMSQNNLCSWPYPVSMSKTIVELNLDNNKISVLPDQVHNMTTLKHLRLRNNHIRRLPKLHRMVNLELAEFRNNSIQNFPDFYGSIHLREVWLDNNQIQKVDANCLIGTVVRILSISSNKLNEINGHFSLLDTLRYLDISNNELKTLPYDFSNMNKIIKIKLNGNNFMDPNIVAYNKMSSKDLIQYIADIESDKKYMIPEGPRYIFIENYRTKDIIKSDNLQDCLKMTTDSTGRLPNWMFCRAEYDEILRLDLSNNRHVQLPSHLWKIAPFLEELFCCNNLLVRLPASIGSFAKLRILDLYSNSLTTLPQELIYCTELYCLNISSNLFEEIPLIVFNLKSLELLFATNNKIKVINFAMLRKFRIFDVSKNCIQKFVLHKSP